MRRALVRGLDGRTGAVLPPPAAHVAAGDPPAELRTQPAWTGRLPNCGALGVQPAAAPAPSLSPAQEALCPVQSGPATQGHHVLAKEVLQLGKFKFKL